jgi:uncharacterized hydrophobic protein (TIGR00271 family)
MEEGSMFSFNYNVLLMVASILAGLALVSNSSATVIASMLISPIMGPVVGLAYGTTICDWKLVRRSLKVEIISLIICILVGFTIGVVTGPTNLSNDWPTAEMTSRGSWTNFYVALPIAFFSGLGVAVSLLDDQTSSLVGVAISASLLPPAVNAGILWIAYIFAEHEIINSDTIPIMPLPAVGADEPGVRFLAEDDLNRKDYREMGIVSLNLTLANIVLIWLSSMLMFRVKEVLPISKNVFWNDLEVARKIYQRKAVLAVADENLSPVEGVKE